MSTVHSTLRALALPVRPLRRKAARWRRARQAAQRRHVERTQWDRVDRLVFELTGGVVRSGPFEGMRFVPTASWGTVAPMLLGSYERQLHGVIEALVSSGPTRVIDVGSAEEYYAVGLALRLPQSTVYAYDIDVKARDVCSDVARLNSVGDRVVVRGGCRAQDLTDLVGEGCALIVDCEGFEIELLDKSLVPGLSAATILVEFHDFVDPAISATILKRFADTHEATVVRVTDRIPEASTQLGQLSEDDRRLAFDEHRSVPAELNFWAFLVPRITRVGASTPGSEER